MKDRKKPGRARGHGNGALQIRKGPSGDKWVGCYRVYEGNKPKKREFLVGSCADMTREEARRKVTETVSRIYGRERAVRFLGPTSKFAEENIGRISTCTGFKAARNGTLAEMAVCIDLISKGWEVYRSVSQVASCDLLAMKNGSILRIESKYTHAPSTSGNIPRIDLRRNAGKFDLVAVVFGDGKIVYGSHDEIGDFLRPNLSVRDFPGEDPANSN